VLTTPRQRWLPALLLLLPSPSSSLSVSLSLPLSSLLLSLWCEPESLLRLLLELRPLLPLPSAAASSGSDSSPESECAEKQPAGAGANALGSSKSSKSMPPLLALCMLLLLLDPAMNSDSTLGLPGLCRLGPRALRLGLLLAVGLLGELSFNAKRTAKLRLLLLDFDNPPRALTAAEPSSVSLPPSAKVYWLLLISKSLNELLSKA
jgi:hypothetical protein